jgi:hypothetical protein
LQLADRITGNAATDIAARPNHIAFSGGNMTARKSTLTQERLKELLSYDPETGVFTNLVLRNHKSARAGAVAGSKNQRNYVEIRIANRNYYAHRLAWLYMLGEWPPALIDHIDTDCSNNKWANLRSATHRQNQQNRRRAISGKIGGMLGANWMESKGKWRARIRIDGKETHLGLFATKEDAHATYLAAKALHHPFQTLVQT